MTEKASATNDTGAKPGATRGHKTKVVIAGVLITAVVTIIIVNLNLGARDVEKHIEPIYAVSDSQFVRTMGSILGPSLVGGNRVETLLNGDQILPAMLSAISGAQRTITFETYVYSAGVVGKQFTDALSERASNGVRVHVLLDWVGAGKIDKAHLAQMEQAGIKVVMFNPPHFYQLGQFNDRTHRKVLVVDGRIGFTGGAGVGDQWLGNAQDSLHWRETHYRIEGPAVAQLQAVFLDNWIQVTGEVLHGDAYFPVLADAGTEYAQMFGSAPGDESMQLMYLLSIAGARKTIHLSAAYFVPDKMSIRALTDALGRGVQVRIIVLGPVNDAGPVRNAGRHTWGALLRAGAQIYEYQTTMFHSKVMVVDSLWTSVGSTNFDERSFKLNDENNLNVLDSAFAHRQVTDFEEDVRRSRLVTLAEWENRPWRTKVWDRLMALFRSQM